MAEKVLSAEERIAQLEQENAALRSQGIPGYSPEDAKFIQERIALGLDQKQAEEVLRQQRLWEAHPLHPDNQSKRQPTDLEAAQARIAELEAQILAGGESAEPKKKKK